VKDKRIIVHSLAHARAALGAARALKRPITLVSAAGCAGSAGPLWFKSLIDAAATEYPAAVAAVLDCGDEPGMALNALRHGLKRLRVAGEPSALTRLKDIARQSGAAIETGKPPPALDLLDVRDPAAAVRAYLGPRRGKAAKRRPAQRRPRRGRR
jgi:hypothetical protein